MLRYKLSFFINLIFLISFLTACGKKAVIPSIGSNISYPGSLIALNNNHFLLLNTSANSDYNDGSIQEYSVDATGNHTLENVISVPSHGSEIAVSPDSKLVALSFDNSVNPTQIKFYNYTDITNPLSIPLVLNFNSAGGKQSIKRLGFFTPTGGTGYYLYGVIYNFPQDDGTNGNIPSRVFVANISQDFSSARILFNLSYGIEGSNDLAPKSDSSTIYSYAYSFGSNSPTFDAAHNLFIAFPTGSVGGVNSSGLNYPPYPSNIYDYYNKTIHTPPNTVPSNKVQCSTGVDLCPQPDLRIVSLFAVDFTDYLANNDLNNSTYFVPLAWNSNGIPYAGTTNGITINYANYISAGGTSTTMSNNSDLNSFSFQYNFWSSKWMNTFNLGDGGACYLTSTTTSSSNQYDLKSDGNNSLLVSKLGLNNSGDNGYGNEVFQITGLDILSSSIATIKAARGNYNPAGENDFSAISSVQILDPYNTYISQIQSTWLNGVSPITPYMYSRTTGVTGFDTTTSAAINFGVLNFGANKCLPYWVRDTYLGFGSWGMDSAWLSASPVNIVVGSNTGFANATIDPNQPALFSFPYASGAQLCTDVSPTSNTPIVFCANFLTGVLTHFNTSLSGTIFNQY